MYPLLCCLLFLLDSSPTTPNSSSSWHQLINWFFDKSEIKALGIILGIASSTIAILKFFFPALYEKALAALRLKSRAAEASSTDSIIQNLTLFANETELQKFNDTGSPNQREILQQIIEKEHTSLIVLGGAPGVGKSFLAKKIAQYYAIQKFNKRKFDVVWWIDAEAISLANTAPESNLNVDLYMLAETQKFKIDMASPNWLVQLKNVLQNYNYLLIFDNACDRGDLRELTINKFKQTYFPIPNPNKAQKIIVTSKNKTFAPTLNLNLWSLQEFKNYLDRNLGAKSSQESVPIAELFAKLGNGLPLAISLAVAYMIEQGTTPTTYNILHSSTAYRGNNDVFTTFKISYEALDEKSQALLNLTAFLSPDEMPLIELYEVPKKQDNGSLNFRNALAQLEKYAFVKSEQGDRLQSIHRFWRDTLLTLIEAQGKTNEVYTHTFCQLKLAVGDFKEGQYNFYRNILTHIEVFAEHYSDDTDPEGKIHEALVSLVRAAAKYAFDIGSVSQAIRLNARALALSPNNLKMVHEIGLQNAHNLILRDHCAEALALVNSAYTFFSAAYEGGDKMEMMESARQRIAKVQQRMGNFQVAKQHLKICKERLDDEKLEPEQTRTKVKQKLYSGVLHDLGSVFWEEGLDHNKSIAFLNKAIDYKLSINGNDKNDIHIHFSKMIRGVVKALQGDYIEQVKEHKEVFDFFSSVKEYRRKSYTAYYLLHFGWDKAGWQERYTKEFDPYEIYFTERNDFNDILEGDVKYSIIKAVVALRRAVRLQFNKANEQDAAQKFYNLRSILKHKNGENPNQYLDDGTVSVSAVLDYALYLNDMVGQKKDPERMALLKEVISLAYSLITIKSTADGEHMKVLYHRRNELDSLIERYGY